MGSLKHTAGFPPSFSSTASKTHWSRADSSLPAWSYFLGDRSGKRIIVTVYRNGALGTHRVQGGCAVVPKYTLKEKDMNRSGSLIEYAPDMDLSFGSRNDAPWRKMNMKKQLIAVMAVATLLCPVLVRAAGLDDIGYAGLNIDASAILQSAKAFSEARGISSKPHTREAPLVRIDLPYETYGCYEGVLVFRCVIPGHGGGCHIHWAQVQHSAESATSLRFTNLSISGYPFFILTDIGAGVKKTLLLYYIVKDEEHTVRDGLPLDTGDNRIRIDLLKNEEVLKTEEVTIKTLFTWGY